ISHMSCLHSVLLYTPRPSSSPPSLSLSLPPPSPFSFPFFSFNDTAPTEIYTLSLHDALPIFIRSVLCRPRDPEMVAGDHLWVTRSEEHTSELQSLTNLVCRLLLEKKKKRINTTYYV